MRFFLFLLSYSLNPLIFYTIPPNITTNFLFYYTISSAFFSLFMLFTFFWMPLLSNIRLLVFLSIISFILAFNIFGDTVIWVFYPYTLLLGDYITTQSGLIKASNYYRILMVLSAVPFIFFPESFYTLILLRILISILFAVLILGYFKNLQQLSIDSPARWIATTYIFYSGTLLLVPIIGDDTDIVKFWYIGMQVGIGLILKQLDFSVRAINRNYQWLFMAINFFVILIPIVLLILYRNYIFFAMYLISISALYYLKKVEA